MKEAFRMSALPTLLDSPSVTFSPASVAGRSRSSSPVSQVIHDCGLDLVLANLSARQARAMGLLTSDTYGPTSISSLSSAALQSSLASKLRVLTDSAGSILYTLTWKERATPSGLRICALRASGHRTSGSGFTGWPTATTTDSVRCPSQEFTTPHITLNHAAVMAGWPTPVVNDETGSTHAYGKDKQIMLKLSGAARLTDPQDQWPHSSTANLTGWPTPMAGTPAQNGNNAAGNNDSSRKTVELAGSTAGTASTGQLNPAFSLWLMGYPSAWQQAVPGWLDWLAWQGLMAQVSSEQRNTDSLR